MNKYKKLFCILLSSIIIFSMFFGCSKKEKDESHSEKERHSQTTEEPESTTKAPKYNLVNGDKLTVAFATFKPFIYKENETVVGFDSEIIGLIAEKLGYEPDFVEVEKDKITSAVNNGNADIAIGAIDSTTENRGVLFSETYATAKLLTEDSIEEINFVIVINSKSKLYDDVNEQLARLKNDGTIEKLMEKYGMNKLLDLDGIVPEHTDTKGKSIRVDGFPTMTFDTAGNLKGLILSNDKNNPCYLQYSIYVDRNKNDQIDDADTLIYKSDLIPPGYSVSSFKLDKKLSKGSYAGLVYVETYSYDVEMRHLQNIMIKPTIIVE